MSTLQSLRIELIEILTGYTNENENLFENKLKEFVQEYSTEMKRMKRLKPLPPPLSMILQVASRETTPPRRSIVSPRKWNTPVSPFTGVAMDGSDDHCHAPLPRECPPLNFEHFLAQNVLKNLRFFATYTGGPEAKKKSLANLLSILTEARKA